MTCRGTFRALAPPRAPITLQRWSPRRIGLALAVPGIGLSPGAAVSAVLTFRLATYWLPVPPGWLCWRQLQRMDYI